MSEAITHLCIWYNALNPAVSKRIDIDDDLDESINDDPDVDDLDAVKGDGKTDDDTDSVKGDDHADVAKLREEIEQKEAILTEERLSELKDQYSQRQLELRLFAQKAQSDLDRLERKKTMEIIDEIENAVKEIGTKEGFDLIFKKRHLLWGSPALDLTGSVLDILNKQEGT